ncbi:MAG: DegV family protein [Clostridiales bacterium]|nr:DegV family protein [Clostridiales bacterium]
MQNFVLSCCSTVDLSSEHLKSRDIPYIPFHFMLGDQQYTDDLGASISYKDFYQAMRQGKDTKTSQVNVDEFVKYFEPFLKEGKDILHISLSSGVSGVLNSANTAASMLSEKYPDAKIYVVDSLGASSGYGLLMDKLADLRDEGMGIVELKSWAEANRLLLHHWFFSIDLTFFVKGGRISKASGWFGTALRICPLLNMNDTGHLRPRFKLRGKAKAIKEIADKMEQFAQGQLQYSDKCYLSHSDCFADAKKVVDLVEERFTHLKGKVLINNIGTTVGCHTGPGTVALFFWGDKRED